MNIAIKLFDRTIRKESSDCFLILEAGTNHYELSDFLGISLYDAAYSMVLKAKASGADAVKFQIYNADKTASDVYAKNQYQYMRRRDSMSMDEYKKLIKESKKINMPIFFSFFDLEIIESLGDYVGVFKVASPDINNNSLLEAINTYRKPVILSTSGSYEWEIENALALLKNCNVAIMHCRGIYPTEKKQLDLGAIKTLNKEFPKNVIGWSSHNPNSLDFCSSALALGANIMEFHFKTVNEINGGDYPVSISAKDAFYIKTKLRDFSFIYGNESIRVTEEEMPLRINGRRGLYAKKDLLSKTRISREDFIALRPSSIKGLNVVSASEGYNFSNMEIKMTIKKGEPLTKDDLKVVND